MHLPAIPRAFMASVFLLACSSAALAQPQLKEDAHIAARPSLEAGRLAEGAEIKVDGRLDEATWAGVPVASDFTDSDPVDGARPSERTEVRITHDQDAIYVGARLHTVNTRVSTRLGRRDSDLSDSDWFIVVFDSYHDHQGGYRFRVNPSGVTGDEANGDRSWDPIWEVATAVDDSGWTAEMRIPFSQLRFNPADRPVWGLQFYREVARTVEKMMFAYTPKSDKGGSARFGHLLGLKDIVPGHPLELLPFAAARAEYKRISTPFRDGHDYYRNFGADIKYRPTPNFTLDATLNPDFGQIEADEAQVNLSANETFFGEKRPFFIEGANIFRFGGGDLFYSRRIGRAPQGSLPSASVFGDVADATTILGAAKLTGRTASGWSLGIMEAVANRERAPWVGTTSDVKFAEVEPLTNYFVGRAKRDFRGGASSFGAILTQTTRALGDSSLRARLRGSATVAGIDLRHETSNREWGLNAQVAGSTVRGSESAMIATQRSSLRYFQRPDDDRAVDSSARSMEGIRASVGLSKSAGLHWRGGMNLNATSPGFETNDLAFQTSADRATISGNIEYQENRPGNVWRRWELKASPDYGYNYTGDRVQSGLRLEAEGTLLSYWTGKMSWDHDWSRFDDRLTRGGPVTLDPGQTTWQVNVSSNPRLPYTIGGNASRRVTPAGGWSNSGSVKFGVKAASTWSAEIEPRFSRGYGTSQYITSVADTTATATFGRRYVFAPIDQTTLSLTSRVNVTMRPTMTLAIVMQPLVASGLYGSAIALSAPRTYDFHPVSDATDYRNFNTRTVNGSAAFRWEWRPGSSAYLVWQHRRNAPGTAGDFRWRRDRAELFRAAPENTLMVKLSYWINP